MKSLRFMVRYALATLGRNRQRTLFVLFCIAAGVAAVVSLRSLGLMIQDSLTGNLQQANRGDLVISPSNSAFNEGVAYLPDGTEEKVDPTLFEGDGSLLSVQSVTLSESGYRRVTDWAAGQGFDIMPAWTNNGPFMRLFKVDGDAAEFSVIYCVEPQRYPFYGRIDMLEPAGSTLNTALSGPHEIALSQDLMETLDLQLGDQVRLIGAAEPFTVAAVTDRRSEVSPNDLLSAIFPLAYVPYQTCVDELGKLPNRIYLQTPAGTDVKAVSDELLTEFPGLYVVSTEDLLDLNRQFSEAVAKLVTVTGLVSLLIGGMGIANTMMVMVNRRRLEIAVLKTVGTQGERVVLQFVIEALILGAAGSLLGVLLGLGLSLPLRNVGELFVSRSVQAAVYPEAIGLGLLLGVVVTLAFALLPTLAAGRVRPIQVLHPQDAPSSDGGRRAKWLDLLVVLALTAVMGLIVGQIVEDTLIGLLIAYLSLIALALATGLLRGLVWVLVRLPSLGSISLQLSQRLLDEQKGRAAGTLLALTTGVFSLSLILLLAQGTLKQIGQTAEQFIGGNVLVAVQSLEVGRRLEKRVEALPGVISLVHDTVYQVELVAINGDRDIATRVEAAKNSPQLWSNDLNNSAPERIDQFVSAFDMKVLEDDTWEYSMAAGRDITAHSMDELVLEPSVYDNMFEWFNLRPGDTLAFRFASDEERTATVAGIADKQESGWLAISNFRETYGIVPPNFVPAEETPVPSFYALKVNQAQMNETLTTLSEIPGTFIVSVNQLTLFTERIVEQFSSIPYVVAVLALFASAVIIANTVSLATLERRREIGIMKAVGVQSERVLGMLLLENGLVGLAAGVIGVGLGTLVILAAGLLGEGSNLPFGAFGLLILLSVGVALGATLVAAAGAVREKPLHVLRYE